MLIGSFGEELLRAFGLSAVLGKARLSYVVDAAIKKHGYSDAMTAEIVEAVRADPQLALEVLEEMQMTRPLMRNYAERRLHALKKAGVHIPAGHADRGTQRFTARRDDTNGHEADETRGGGHSRPDLQESPAPAAQETRGGQSEGDAHGTSAPAAKSAPASGGEPQDRAGHRPYDTHSMVARPAHKPRKFSKRATEAVARSVLDRIEINGQKLGDVTPDEALGWAEKAAERVETVQRICSGLAPTVPIRQQLSSDEAEARAVPS